MLSCGIASATCTYKIGRTPALPVSGRPTAVDGQKLYASPVGYGEMKIKEIIGLLKADGYTGPLSIEHYGAPRMLEYLEKSAEWVKAQM